MNKNQVHGRTDEAKGKIKEVTGKATGNKSMENRGKAEKLGGKVEAAVGDLKQDIKKASR
ncbi:MAG: CsbD family protein [Wenzhouxiangella sp.]